MKSWLMFVALAAGFSVSDASADPELRGGQQGFGSGMQGHHRGFGPEVNVDLGLLPRHQPSVCETVRHLCLMHYGPDEDGFGDCMWRHRC